MRKAGLDSRTELADLDTVPACDPTTDPRQIYDS
jgi:hypothetical protein